VHHAGTVYLGRRQALLTPCGAGRKRSTMTLWTQHAVGGGKDSSALVNSPLDLNPTFITVSYAIITGVNPEAVRSS